MRFKDRHGRTMVLGPTHEEVVMELVKATVNSYKQLPLTLYQIQTKFRDEFRPRFGLLRVREFLMKDAYSFDADVAGLDRSYDLMYRAYERIFTRCGIPYVAVEAESGPIGGGASHEFMVLSDSGEDVVVTSDRGNYSANLERAGIGERAWTFGGEPRADLEKLHTPNLPGIDDVARFLKIEPKQMLKTLVFKAHGSAGGFHERVENLAHPKWLVAVVRGDHDVNEAKLSRAAREDFHIEGFELIDAPEVRATWAIGFVGPDAAVRHPEAVVVIDPEAAQGATAWVTGANEADHHVKGFNWFRECGDRLADPRKVVVADVRNARDGDLSPKNDGGLLRLSKGIEIGHVFKLGTKYSDAMDAQYIDEHGEKNPFIMGCYGIGIGRILIAAVESLHDERGIVWPPAIAPYSVVITPIMYEGEVKAVSDKLHDELSAAGIDTILDDRDARPGFKFADADLIGFPVRINVGERGLREGKVELKSRRAADAAAVPQADVVERVRRELAGWQP